MTTTTTTTATLRAARELIAASALLCACTTPLRGSGSIAHDVRTPGPFSELEIAGDYQVQIQLGRPSHSLVVDVDDNLVSSLRSVTNGKRLTIDAAHDLRPSRRIKLSIQAPDAALVRLRGSNAVTVTGVANERFQIDVDGGGGTEASGTTEQLKVYVVGSAELKLEKLAVNGGALVNVDGSGSVDVAEPKQLDVEIHGSGRVGYGGAPTITQKVIRGSGQLVKR